MKIVFFGDSITQGSYGASYVDKVAAMMRGHHFINEGINGDTSLNLFRRVDQYVIAHHPDAAFIMVGINDAISHAEPATRPYYRLIKGVRNGQVSPIAFRENVRTVLMKLIVANIQVWVALPPIEYRPALVNALREMNDYAAEVCAELKVPMLDLMALLTPAQIPDRPPLHVFSLRSIQITLSGSDYDRFRAEGNYTYSFDGIHLADTGAQQIADAVVPFLRQSGVK